MPPALTAAALRTQLASGRLDSLYLIKGDDEAEKGELAQAFVATIDEGLQAFNSERFFGGDPGVTSSAIIQAARTLPMMAPRRIVLVLRAERLLIPKRESEASERELEALAGFFDKPDPTATVVFVAEAGLDERRRVVKRLVQRATVVECGGPGDAAQWARGRASEDGLQFQPDALRLIVTRAGADAARLRADVERVLLYAQGQGRITAADVEAVTGGATSQDPWAVANAIERGDAATALRELALAFDAGAVSYMVLGQLAWIARAKLPGARVPAAIDAVFRTDLALKSSGGDPRVLLERLVVELCGK